MQFFGTDGIRDKQEFFNEEFLLKFCSAIYKKYGKTKIVIGRDTRSSGKRIVDGLISYLSGYAMNVFDAGIVPTGALAFLTRTYGASVGIMVTASHNPPEYNGLKLFNAHGGKISRKDEQEIEKYILEKIAPLNEAKTAKEIGNETYVQYLKDIGAPRLDGLKVVLDCCHGATAVLAERIFTECGATVKVVAGEVDGSRINVNCGATDLKGFLEFLSNESYDVAFSYDGDGDRVIVVKNGEVLNGDHILYVLSSYYAFKGEKITNVVGTVASNMGLDKALESSGIELIRADVGDLNVYDSMAKNDVVLGAESSGHVILKEYGETGDGVLTSVVLALIEKEVGIGGFCAMLEYPSKEDSILLTAEERSFLNDGNYVKEISDEYTSKSVRVVVRLSGTEPKLRVLAESDSYERALETVSAIKKKVECILTNMVNKEPKQIDTDTQSNENKTTECGGYTIVDPLHTCIDETVIIEEGVVVHPFTVVKGNSVLKKNSVIYSFSDITDTVVGEGAIVRSSYAIGAVIGARSTIGPFATLRKNAVIGEDCRVGDYVEIKNATLGDGVKAAHLSYVGDATVGRGTNVGCGTVFANYNGKLKRRSQVGERVFIGCNANIIAPVSVGDDVFIAGGSTITEDVDEGMFTIARVNQVTVPRKNK